MYFLSKVHRFMNTVSYSVLARRSLTVADRNVAAVWWHRQECFLARRPRNDSHESLFCFFARRDDFSPAWPRRSTLGSVHAPQLTPVCHLQPACRALPRVACADKGGQRPPQARLDIRLTARRFSEAVTRPRRRSRADITRRRRPQH